jgi:acyl carrier protein
MESTISTVDEVRMLVAETLGIEDRLDSMNAATGLLGSLPELDSMAVVLLITTIEEKFGFEIDQADFTADAFDSIGSLATFIDENRPS